MAEICRLLLLLVSRFLTQPSLGLGTGTPSTPEVSPKIEWVYIPYADLGKTVSSSDEKLGFRMMPEAEVARNKDTVYTQFTSTKYAMVDSNEEASRLLDISGSLQLQLNVGAIGGSADGTGSYLHESGDRSQYAELLFVAKVVKKFEVLKNLDFTATKAQCDLAKTQKTTHVITGMTYGGQCLISCRIRTSENSNKEEINAEVKANLGLANITLDAEGALKLHNQLQNRFENITVKTYCNANLKNAPTNLAEAVEVVQSSLGQVRDQNTAGVPIAMELTPLSQFPNCQGAVVPNPAFFDIYLEGLSAMVDDLRVARGLLFKCIDAYPLDKSKAELSKKIEDMDTKLKDVHLKLTTALLTVNQVGSVSQFDQFDAIYSDNAQQKMWNHKFWAMRVHHLCYSMRENKFVRGYQKSVEFKSAAIIQKCITDRQMVDEKKILSSSSESAFPAAAALTRTCFKSANSGSGVFWMARISRPDFVYSIQATENSTQSHLDFYLSDDPSQFRQQFDVAKFQKVEPTIAPQLRLLNAVLLVKLRPSSLSNRMVICSMKLLGGPCTHASKDVKT